MTFALTEKSQKSVGKRRRHNINTNFVESQFSQQRNMRGIILRSSQRILLLQQPKIQRATNKLITTVHQQLVTTLVHRQPIVVAATFVSYSGSCKEKVNGHNAVQRYGMLIDDKIACKPKELIMLACSARARGTC